MVDATLDRTVLALEHSRRSLLFNCGVLGASAEGEGLEWQIRYLLHTGTNVLHTDTPSEAWREAFLYASALEKGARRGKILQYR